MSVGFSSGDGSEEYLALMAPGHDDFLIKFARGVGLQVVRDYRFNDVAHEKHGAGNELNELLDSDDVESCAPFKHFNPPFMDENHELGLASLVNATFVFVKCRCGRCHYCSPPRARAEAVVPPASEEAQPEKVASIEPAAAAATDTDTESRSLAPVVGTPAEPLQLSPDGVAKAAAMFSGAPGGALGGAPMLPAIGHEQCKGVAIIVCFRNQRGQRREQELRSFIPHMSRIMSGLQAAGRLKNWHIFVIQQKATQIAKLPELCQENGWAAPEYSVKRSMADDEGLSRFSAAATVVDCPQLSELVQGGEAGSEEDAKQAAATAWLEQWLERVGYRYQDEDVDNVKFNRGKLLNIGFQITPPRDYDTLIFHDVDLLPVRRIQRGVIRQHSLLDGAQNVLGA